MKVTLVNATDGGGAGVATLRLYHALKKAGVDVKVLLQKAKKPEVLSNPDIAVWVNNSLRKVQYLHRHWLEKRKIGGGSTWANFSTGLYGVDTSSHPFIMRADVVHMHWINDNFISIKHMLKFQRPLVWTFHDMWPYTGGFHYVDDEISVEELQAAEVTDPRMELYAKIWLEKAEVYPHLNLSCVSPSNWLANLGKRAPLLKGKSVQAIPNPIDTNVYRLGDKIVARKNWSISADANVVLFGSFNVLNDQRKGFMNLKSALEILAHNHPELNNIELAVIGRENEELAEQVPFKVHFLGFHNNDTALAQCYQVADIFALPSEQDNLPNMCLEALSCGLPVVAFNIGGVPDMVLEGQTGLLSDLKDHEGMAANLYKLLADIGLRNEMSQNARTHVLAHFSDQVVANKMTTLYRQLLKG